MTLEELHAENLSQIWDALFKRRSPELYGLSREGLSIETPTQSKNPNIPPSLGGFRFLVPHPKYVVHMKVEHESGDSYRVALFELSTLLGSERTVLARSTNLREMPLVVKELIEGYFHMMRML